MNKVLSANHYSVNKSTNRIQASTDPVTVQASFILRNNSHSSINLQMQRQSCSVVGLMMGSGFNTHNSVKYDHIKSKVKTGLSRKSSAARRAIR